MSKIVVGLIMIAYIISPIDLLPDPTPFIGTLDDGLAGAILASLFRSTNGGKRK